MINLTDLQQLEHWGYSLLPAAHDDSPGYTGVVIMMQDAPDPAAFVSPISLHIHTLDPDGSAYWETLHANSKWIPFHSICPGKFHIHDKQGNETAFFSFGATIKVEEQDGETIFTISSEAPILELSQKNQTVATDFSEEVEGLLARLEARWTVKQNGHHDFFEYVSQTFSPLDLYTSSIQTLLTHFNDVSALRHSNPKLYHMLQQEKAYAQETLQWSENSLRFDDLFMPSEKK